MKDHEGRDFCLVSLVLTLVSTKICVWTLTEWISNFGLGPPHPWYGVKESLLRFFFNSKSYCTSQEELPFFCLPCYKFRRLSFSLFLVATTIILFWRVFYHLSTPFFSQSDSRIKYTLSSSFFLLRQQVQRVILFKGFYYQPFWGNRKGIQNKKYLQRSWFPDCDLNSL